jgi:hypothetical protein
LSFNAGIIGALRNAGRNPGTGEGGDRLEPALRCRGARLHAAGQSAVERRDRYRHARQPVLGHLAEDVEVALDQCRFGHDRDRVAKVAEHLQDRARDAEPAFYRLVGIGIAAERDRPAVVSLFPQFPGEQRRRIGLVEQAALEIEAGRQAEIGMTRPCVAIDAAVLAAAVRIDRAVEADIRRVVAGDDRPRRVYGQCRGQRHRLFV